MDTKKIIKYMLSRSLSTGGNTFMEVAAYDDKKKNNRPYSTFFNLSKSNESEIIGESEIYNIGVYGVFLSLNPLNTNIRQKKYVKKILYAFVDLDGASEEHYNLIKDFLENKGITFMYTAKSGNGYHLLIPIELEPSQEQIIKNFLHYLKDQVCNKVDTAVGDISRTMRFPGSIHNKTDKEIMLKTLSFNELTEEQITKNIEIVSELQYENKKGVEDNTYLGTIKLKDVFFNNILNSEKNKEYYIKYLKKSKERNNIFLKNLGIFINQNKESLGLATHFIKSWDVGRLASLNGWIKKSHENNMSVNYKELLLWSKENDLEIFVSILNQQLQDALLDNMEFYFLDDEKNDNAYLIYYPNSNYYVSKGFQAVLNTIYYEFQEKGIEPLSYFKINYKNKDGDIIPHNKRIMKFNDLIHGKLDFQRRIKKVHNINYKPIDEKFIWLNGKKYFNSYKKTYYTDLYLEEEEYHFKHIKELIMNLCGGDEKSFKWFTHWLAWIIQNPTLKLPTAVILQGEQGTGKGVLKNLVLDNIFGDNCIEINQNNLESSFNGYMFGKQIIVANEVIHNENKVLLPNILKTFVTDEYITIQRKFKSELVCENFSHWIFCTNNDNPLKIDDGDRRYSVFYSKKLKGSEANAARFVKELRINLNYELEQFVSYLKSIKVDEIFVRQPLMTEAKADIIEINKTSFDRFVESLSQFKDFKEAYISINTTDRGLESNNGEQLLLAEFLYKMYHKWCEETSENGVFGKQMFSRKISNFNIKSKVERIEKGDNTRPLRVYCLSELEGLIK